METELRLGNIRDKFDARDRPLYTTDEVQAFTALASESAPGAGSPFVLPDLPPVYNQGGIGSCVANAVASALRYAHKKSTGTAYKDFEPSRMFLYYNARVNSDPVNINIAGNPNAETKARHDGGSHNRSAIHSLLMQGVCLEALWPYGNPSSDQTTHLFEHLDKKPNPIEPEDWNKATWQAKGSSHLNDPKALSGEKDIIPRAIGYYRIFDPALAGAVGGAAASPPPSWEYNWNNVPTAWLEKTLLDGFPFVFGVRIYKDADLRISKFTPGGVLVKPPTNKSEDMGGHAMMAIGFDSAKKLFLVQNSWGSTWPADITDASLKGRFWMPYEWFERSVNNLPCTYDYWVIKTS
ncbi:hypothetical protein AYL99_03783 [Fonsecaea erecta]|uniref:Peptidase C1A papain C-terminal domain-containing protein n=1 Tax=Fonsecaea erecta TaxID=1367422 RepID=A0A178ZP46_9EURO|nr:hypothetical protein AYL99_03783 [Fonsecaea erecta]OAP61580.1 hypothetical protein AYL99_03783 [Fonsecaea erecta]